MMIERNNIPFRTKPAKAAEKAADMWRDIERRAAITGLERRAPAPCPLTDRDAANRVAALAAAEGRVAPYARATDRPGFGEGLEPGVEPNLSRSLRACGEDPARAIAGAASAQIGEACERATAEARGLGMFGVPTLVVGKALFRGDDRLDDATAWRRRSPPAA